MDNSCAIKRWTRSSEWARIIRNLGIKWVEASAGTKADPFYRGFEHLSDWIEEVRSGGKVEGVGPEGRGGARITGRRLGTAPTCKIAAKAAAGTQGRRGR